MRKQRGAGREEDISGKEGVQMVRDEFFELIEIPSEEEGVFLARENGGRVDEGGESGDEVN